jgi:hypothetical protein
LYCYVYLILKERKMFEPGDVVISARGTGLTIEVITIQDNDRFCGVVLDSGSYSSYKLWNRIGETDCWPRDDFELHHDLTRLKKLERIFKDEI